jgi:hypothetical protein
MSNFFRNFLFEMSNFEEITKREREREKRGDMEIGGKLGASLL